MLMRSALIIGVGEKYSRKWRLKRSVSTKIIEGRWKVHQQVEVQESASTQQQKSQTYTTLNYGRILKKLIQNCSRKLKLFKIWQFLVYLIYVSVEFEVRII